MKIGIVGRGYVGLPLAVAFAQEGHEVVGVDIDQRKVASLRDGESYIEDVASERLSANVDKLRWTHRYADLAACEGALESLPLGQVLEGADAAVILTAHPGLDVEQILASAPVVVDFRGVREGSRRRTSSGCRSGSPTGRDGTGRGVTVTAAKPMAE